VSLCQQPPPPPPKLPPPVTTTMMTTTTTVITQLWVTPSKFIFFKKIKNKIKAGNVEKADQEELQK